MLILATLLTPIIDQECTHMSYLITGERQWEVQGFVSVLPTHCLYVPHCSHYASGALD